MYEGNRGLKTARKVSETDLYYYLCHASGANGALELAPILTSLVDKLTRLAHLPHQPLNRKVTWLTTQQREGDLRGLIDHWIDSRSTLGQPISPQHVGTGQNGRYSNLASSSLHFYHPSTSQT
ncbi:unnamed protein product [Protopolystoma xenopodis]|uniref:Uncharacterized protein n=1 Tax=Protopolystoma xenopodis TaxID=117903 RepID=A0A448X884_9PLAT|nr:unnamed protein product [Protopolystoma xenopodis]